MTVWWADACTRFSGSLTSSALTVLRCRGGCLLFCKLGRPWLDYVLRINVSVWLPCCSDGKGSRKHGPYFSSASCIVLGILLCTQTTMQELFVVKAGRGPQRLWRWMRWEVLLLRRGTARNSQSWFHWLQKSLSRWTWVTFLFRSDLPAVCAKKPRLPSLHQTTVLMGRRLKGFSFAASYLFMQVVQS